MAIEKLPSEVDDDGGPVGPLEEPITAAADALQGAIDDIALIAGSYLRAYMRYARMIVRLTSERVFWLWLLLLMPYLAWASVGEYLTFHVPFYLPTGVIGLLLMLIPTALIGTPAYALIRAWFLLPSNVVPFALRRRPLLSKLVVPRSPSGHAFWLYWVVGGSILLTLTVEIGWICGFAPLAGIHDTVLAWPNVWLLDRVRDGVGLVFNLVGRHR